MLFWPKLFQRLALDRLKESILFSILYLIGCISWYSMSTTTTTRKRGRPYVYSPTTVLLRCFIVRLWFRLDSNNALHIFLNRDCQYNHKLVLACGLVSIPNSRRTFERRLKTISTDIKERISTTMEYLFAATEGMVMVMMMTIL